MRRDVLHRLKRAGLVLAGLCLGLAHAAGQEGAPVAGWQFGLNIGGGLSTPSASFSRLPGVDNCLTNASKFSSGSGGGFSVAGMLGRRPAMSEDWQSHLGFTVKLGYATAGTTFEVDERIGSAVDTLKNIYDVIDRYTVETRLSMLRLEPAVQYYMGPDFPMTISLGTMLGFVLGGTYEQNEQIVSPSGARFEDGSTERNRTSGDLQELSRIQGGLSLGLGYDLAVSPMVTIRPEITGLFNLTKPISTVSWNPHELRAGISVLFMPAPAEATPLEPGEQDGQK